MGWDGMAWHGMGWHGMGWDGMGWDGMGRDAGAAEREEAPRWGTRREEQWLQNSAQKRWSHSLSPQPLAMPWGASTAVPCAQDHKMFIIRLWLPLSSCSSKLWNCLCHRKVKLRTAGWQALQLEQAAGSGRNSRGERHCRGWPRRTSRPVRGLATGGTRPASRLPCRLAIRCQGAKAEDNC